jgi:hypothetical protein
MKNLLIIELNSFVQLQFINNYQSMVIVIQDDHHHLQRKVQMQFNTIRIFAMFVYDISLLETSVVLSFTNQFIQFQIIL